MTVDRSPSGRDALFEIERRTLADYGVEPLEVGISRVMLPQDTTTAVFDRMSANRDRVAADIEASGKAAARTAIDTAESQARIISAFAERRAQDFRSRGDLEAAEFLKQMDTNSKLAVFLKNVELMRNVLAKRITLVLPDSMPGMSLVSPGALDHLKAGEIPSSGTPTTPEELRAIMEKTDASVTHEEPR